MKLFEKMGWIRQGFLSLIVCVVISPSHAMSVRERYLSQHPEIAAQEAVKSTPQTQVVKHTKKHRAVEKETTVRQKISQRRHAQSEQPLIERKKVVSKKAKPKNVERKVEGQKIIAKRTRHEKVESVKVVKQRAEKRNLRDVDRKVARDTPVKKVKRVQASKKTVVQNVRQTTATKRQHRPQ